MRRGVAWFMIDRHAVASSQAPAVQLQQTAAALVADDKKLGVARADAVVSRLAKATPKNAAPWLAGLSSIFSCIGRPGRPSRPLTTPGFGLTLL